MALKDPHGVVVVRFSSGTVHRAETGQGHGESALETGDWELSPTWCWPERRGTSFANRAITYRSPDG